MEKRDILKENNNKLFLSIKTLYADFVQIRVTKNLETSSLNKIRALFNEKERKRSFSINFFY